MDNISRKIYLLRLIHNYTQAYVAEKIGIGCSTYTALELNASRISISKLEKLVVIYDLTLADFFSFEVNGLMKVIAGQKEAVSNQADISPKRLILQLQTLNKLLFQLLEESKTA